MRRKRSLIISGLILACLGCTLLLSATDSRAVAQDASKEKTKAKSQLDGAWRLVSSKDPASGEQRKIPEGAEMSKLLTGGRFVWTAVQEKTAIAGAGGRYTVADDSYTEEILFAIGENQQALPGKSFKFSWKIEDGKWHHKGTLKIGDNEQEIDEIWEHIP